MDGRFEKSRTALSGKYNPGATRRRRLWALRPPLQKAEESRKRWRNRETAIGRRSIYQLK